MAPSRKDEYQARADECTKRAADTDDAVSKTQWLKNADAWQTLADALLK